MVSAAWLPQLLRSYVWIAIFREFNAALLDYSQSSEVWYSYTAVQSQPGPSQSLIKDCLLVWSSGRSWCSWIEAYNTQAVVIQQLISGCSTMGKKWDWKEQGVCAQSLLLCRFGTLTRGFIHVALLCWHGNMGAMKKSGGWKANTSYRKPEMSKTRKERDPRLLKVWSQLRPKKPWEWSCALNRCFCESICYYLKLHFGILDLVFITTYSR